MSGTIKYEMMILLTEEFNDSELKTWAFNYAKTLRKLNASEISVISRGKRDLSYEISNQKRGNFIQINFSSIPKHIEKFTFWLRSKRYSDNTIKTYTEALKSFLTFYNYKDITAITNEDVVFYNNEHIIKN